MNEVVTEGLFVFNSTISNKDFSDTHKNPWNFLESNLNYKNINLKLKPKNWNYKCRITPQKDQHHIFSFESLSCLGSTPEQKWSACRDTSFPFQLLCFMWHSSLVRIQWTPSPYENLPPDLWSRPHYWTLARSLLSLTHSLTRQCKALKMKLVNLYGRNFTAIVRMKHRHGMDFIMYAELRH